MFSDVKCGVSECVRMIRCYPVKVFAPPAVLVAFSLFMRLFGDGTYTLYLALDGRGIFPGAVLYTVGYILRLTLAGLSLSAALFCIGLFEERGKAVLLTSSCSLLMLFEYRMIFISMSIFLEILVCIASALCAFFALVSFLRTKCCGVFALIVYLPLTAFFLVQLASLLFCL